MPTARWMCQNGEIVDYANCHVHAFSGAVKYGAAVFEGIRGYWNADAGELYVFRLREHVERLRYGMRVMRLEPVFEADWLEDAMLRMLRANELREDVHIRMIAYLDGDDALGATTPVGMVVGALPRPSRLGLSKGLHCQISSIARIADNALPPRVKCTANYVNNRAAEIEAKRDGYDGAIMLTAAGKVSEGTGACFFLVRDGVLITPDVTSDILESITRETVIRLAREQLGMPVVERTVDRTEVYAAEEAFWCGSGQEVEPILSMDRIAIGSGETGKITKSLQQAYADLVRGKTNTWPEWRRAVWA